MPKSTQADRERWARRGTTTERGLGAEHQQIREDLLPDAIGTMCPIAGPRCIGLMDDPALMELDHSVARALGGQRGDRIVCAPCNHSEGAKLGNQLRTDQRRAETEERIAARRERELANPAVGQPAPAPIALVTATQAEQSAADSWNHRRKRKRWREDPNAWADDQGIEIYSMQRRINEAVAEHDRVAIRSCHSSGKARRVSDIVPTPAGWSRMGDLRVGDQVFDEVGRPQSVTWVSPRWRMPLWRVMFDDGTSDVVNGPHEWSCIDLHRRPRRVADWREHWDRAVTITTDQMRQSLRVGDQFRWRVPVTGPLLLPDADLPIDPYLLGLWLGDGGATTGLLHLNEDTKAGIPVALKEDGHALEQHNADPRNWHVAGLRTALRLAGLLGRKHIPTAYQRASEQQRRQLLAGIMDSDGFLIVGGPSVGVDWCDRGLADGLNELLVGLGVRVQRTEGDAKVWEAGQGRTTSTRYRLNWRPLQSPFRVRGDGWRDLPGQRSRHTQRTVVSVEPAELEESVCVEVSGERHLYLAGRSMIPTHNSFDMALLVGWWLSVHEPGTARVVTTAPSGDQVRGILWVEINGFWERLNLPGRVNQSEIWYGSYQAGVGRKASDYNPAAMSGWHAPKLLVIVDEADGVSAALWGAIDTLATNVGAKIVGIGNPDDPQSEFRKRQSDQPYGGQYHTIRIAAWDTPNYTGESVSQTIRDALLSPGWVEEMRRKWGARTASEIPDHPFWQSKVEAEYPDEAANGIIRLSDLLRARNFERTGALARADNRNATRAGIDVAGSDSGDESVVRGRRGLRLLDQFTTRTSDPEELEDWLVDHLDLLGAGSVAIDADGIGFGFAGAIRRRRGQRMPVTAIRSAASASDPKTFKNRRAEMWWQLREALAKDGADQLDFTLLDDDTAAQLLMPRYVTTKGKILAESKDELRKRLGRSPDSADALVYGFARDSAGGTVRIAHGRRHLTGRGA